MADSLSVQVTGTLHSLQWWMLPVYLVWGGLLLVLAGYLFITFIAPNPRPPHPYEKRYKTVDDNGKITKPQPLPCWQDEGVKRWKQARADGKPYNIEGWIEPAELFMTVVVPAYNEEKRLVGMLEETVNVLQNEYGSSTSAFTRSREKKDDGLRHRGHANGTTKQKPAMLSGWEILLIDDGSNDSTVLTALNFAQTHQLPARPRRQSGPWTHRAEYAVNIPPGSIRLVSLIQNRGKGGAVTHGMRHARGQYVIFADADGASKFDDIGKLVRACQEVEDADGRGVAVGSRAHLVGSEAVVKRSKLRNFLMHSFHLLLKLMTPPKTARIKDTQCGFKLFSRPALPYIVPYMHSEGWIFDVEMLMLAEFAGIPVVEVAIGWREVLGSKLNVLWDSIGMAWGLALLRFCWSVGVYERGPQEPEETAI